MSLPSVVKCAALQNMLLRKICCLWQPHSAAGCTLPEGHHIGAKRPHCEASHWSEATTLRSITLRVAPHLESRQEIRKADKTPRPQKCSSPRMP